MSDENIQEFVYNPEDDGKADPEEELKGEKVKILYTKPTLAFETFNQKLFSPAVEDGKNSENRYFCEDEKSNRARGSSKKFESPFERVQRMKSEITDLQHQLEALSSGDAIGEISSGAVLENIDNLEMDFGAILNDVRISPYLTNNTPFSKSNLRRPDSELADSIISQVGALCGTGKEGVQYELLYRNKAGDKELRLNEVDRRVSALEKRIGKIGKKDGFKSMHTALGDLYHKLDLLQGSNIDGLTRRIASMNCELTLQNHLLRIKGAKGGEKLITQLHGIMQKGTASAKQLPNTIMGLESQNESHKAQTESILRLQKLQRTQAALQSLLAEDSDALGKAGENIGKNAEILKNNIASFKKRFSNLNAKLKQL